MENELAKIVKSLNLNNLGAEDKEELLRIFNVVKNPALRDQIALVFSEIKYNEAVPSLIKKIKNKELFNNTATLLLSLYDLEAKKYFTSFINIICEQEYEARLMALQLIEKYAGSISAQVKKKSLEILKLHRAEEEKNYVKEQYVNSTLNFIDETIGVLEDT